MRFTRIFLLAGLSAVALGSADDDNVPEAKFDLNWLKETVVPKIEGMGGPGEAHSELMFIEETEEMQSCILPDSMVKAATGSFMIFSTIPSDSKDGKFMYLCQFGRNYAKVVSERKLHSQMMIFEFTRPEEFLQEMQSSEVQDKINAFRVAMPIFSRLNGYFPPSASDKFWGWFSILLVVSVLFCLFAACCCRGVFHYIFCCCFCKKKPEVQKGKKQDPLVLKKDEKNALHAVSSEKTPGTKGAPETKLAKSEETPVWAGEVTIDVSNIEPMTMDLSGIEPMEIPDLGEISPVGEESAPISPSGEESAPMSQGGEESAPMSQGGEESPKTEV